MTALSGRVWIRRAYDQPTRNDGYRILVDRLWPRGVSKEDLVLDEWAREIAPSDDLRRYFNHDEARWESFVERYEHELTDHGNKLAELVDRTREGRITLVYGARDTEHNNAVVLGNLITHLRATRVGD